MFRLGGPEFVIVGVFLLVAVFVNVIPFWFITKKTGHHPALGILSLIPLVNIVFFYFLAFADWPALRAGTRTDVR